MMILIVEIIHGDDAWKCSVMMNMTPKVLKLSGMGRSPLFFSNAHKKTFVKKFIPLGCQLSKTLSRKEAPALLYFLTFCTAACARCVNSRDVEIVRTHVPVISNRPHISYYCLFGFHVYPNCLLFRKVKGWIPKHPSQQQTREKKHHKKIELQGLWLSPAQARPFSIDMYREELLAGRGVGCVATRDIEEGELILSEEPALLLGPNEKKKGVSITRDSIRCEYASALVGAQWEEEGGEYHDKGQHALWKHALWICTCKSEKHVWKRM